MKKENMKQRIDIQDLQGLSEKGKKRLREWWNPEVGDWVISKAEGTYFIYGREENFHDDYGDPELITDNETDSGYYGFELGDSFPQKPTPKSYDYEYTPGKVERAHRILNNTLPLLSIGQMIEFLHDMGGYMNIDFRDDGDSPREWNITSLGSLKYHYDNEELCDVLWSAVKEILEREEK